MNPDVQYFDVTPQMVPADQTSVIRIRPRFRHRAFPDPAAIEVAIYPLEGLLPDGSYTCPGDRAEKLRRETADPLRRWQLRDGELIVTGSFTGEQEHNIQVTLRHPDGPAQDKVLRFNVYSLAPDLYGLRPYKGDFHIHTMFSDGRESPEYVAARYREAGFDFIAVSDHHRYEPSQEAIRYWEALPVDLKLFPGEEVHAPDNPVHIINFAGDCSVNEQFRDDEAGYRREVAERVARLGPVTPGQDPFPIAASEWVFDRIRAGGGLAVFCHPYWACHAYMINEAIATEIFKRRKFDAYELIGGYHKWQTESNMLQLARYQREREQGNRFPVVGLSDSHGTDTDELFGWYYTVVLAKSDSRDDLVNAIRLDRSVAVDAPADESLRLYGDFRLVKYIGFLTREYFPRHRAICATEGELMIAHLGGDDNALPALHALRGRSASYRERCFQPAGAGDAK